MVGAPQIRVHVAYLRHERLILLLGRSLRSVEHHMPSRRLALVDRGVRFLMLGDVSYTYGFSRGNF